MKLVIFVLLLIAPSVSYAWTSKRGKNKQASYYCENIGKIANDRLNKKLALRTIKGVVWHPKGSDVETILNELHPETRFII